VLIDNCYQCIYQIFCSFRCKNFTMETWAKLILKKKYSNQLSVQLFYYFQTKSFQYVTSAKTMYEIIPYSILCKENFYNLRVKFFNGKYTKRCAMSRATTYPKCRLQSLTLIIHSLATLTIDDRSWILIFSNLISFL